MHSSNIKSSTTLALYQTDKTFSDPSSKQIYEGVSINRSPSTPGFLMNSKTEYRQGEVARVEVVRGLGQ